MVRADSKRSRSKSPAVPRERDETARREIAAALRGPALSVREISGRVGLSEKEVHEHLEHIQRTFSSGDCRFVVTPAECIKCGFVFRKRSRLKKPGRCPVCKGELIQEPLFELRGACS